MSNLERDDNPEPNARCNQCAAYLSIVENLLYGNQCIFCSSTVLPLKNIGLVDYLVKCYYDWLIYQNTVALWKLQGHEEARTLYYGIISEFATTNVNSVQDKKKLASLLKSYAIQKETK